jgi:hypothetical protein
MPVHLPQHLEAYRNRMPAISALSLTVEQTCRSGQLRARGTASLFLGVWGIWG